MSIAEVMVGVFAMLGLLLGELLRSGIADRMYGALTL
jgi:hypothetical protein